jgi:hypothetical protein
MSKTLQSPKLSKHLVIVSRSSVIELKGVTWALRSSIADEVILAGLFREIKLDLIKGLKYFVSIFFAAKGFLEAIPTYNGCSTQCHGTINCYLVARDMAGGYD